MSINNSQLQTEFLPVVNEVNNQVIYMDDEDRTYKISNYDQLKENLQNLHEASLQYIYHEDDRQNVKKLKAEINKFEKQFKKKIAEEEKYLFGHVQDNKKDIVRLLNSVKSNIEKGIIQEDERYRTEKENYLIDSFNEAKDAYEEIAQSDFQYQDISKKSWLNRSMSQSKVIEEMNEKISIIDSVLKELKKMGRESTNKDLILQKLNKEKWNSLATINTLKKHFDEEEARLERALKEKEERERKEQERLEEKYQEEKIVETSTLIIAKKDLSRVKAALDRLDINYELGD